tara:strand:+ start:1107 stop:1859 length:753 start_codon:yes stop_codon:yes gene_type:complete
MKILLSNDDGVHAEGIRVLAETLSEIAQVVVVAPDRNKSGASNSLTLHRPIRCTKLDNGFYSVDGTPTDCVHLAITGLLDFDPDMVISGINAGYNLGDDTLYSGTVAAAIEGRFLGYPAIALSQGAENPRHYKAAAIIAKRLVEHAIENKLGKDNILNINIPDLPLEEIKGIEITRCGNRHKAEPIIKALDPRGREFFWIGPAGAEADAGDGTDFHAVHAKKVSISPLKIDMTAHEKIEKLSKWTQNFNL